MKLRYTAFGLLLSLSLVSPVYATTLFPSGGGTGSTTLSGILIGNGLSSVRTLTIGSNLSLIGTTLSATGSGGNSFAYPFPSNATSTSIAFNGGLTGVLTGSLVGNAGTATALAANGANCSAGNYPLGVDASGAAENCTADANTTYTAAYPVTLTATAFGLAFGTTTSNTWAGTQAFTNLITGSISGNAGTATALAANGTNCNAGDAPRGVDASGNAENCTTYLTSAITLIGSTGQTSDGPTVTLATSSDTNIGLTITGSGDTQTFTSTWNGTLADARVSDTLTIGSGSTVADGALSANVSLLGQTIGVAELASADFGSFTCNGSACTVDSAAITAAMLAGADFGSFTCAAGTCTIDNLAVTNAMIAAGTIDLTAKVTGILPIANGGTNASSFGTSNGVTAYDGTRLVNFSGYTLTSALFTATNASTTALTASSYFGAGGATFTIDANGNVTSKDVASGYTGINSSVRRLTLSTATTTSWTASTTGAYIPFTVAPFAGTIKSAQCSTDASFLGIDIYVGSTHLAYFVASTTVGTITFSSNNTFTNGQLINMAVGTTTTSGAVKAACTLNIIQTT